MAVPSEQCAHGIPQPVGFMARSFDMLYFPLFGFPNTGVGAPAGWNLLQFLFDPVFNIADSSIFLGVTSILVFQRKFFPHQEEEGHQEHESELPMNHVRLRKIHQSFL